VHLHWGLSGRRTSLRLEYLPLEDGALTRAMGLLVHYGTAAYVKLPAGYDWDVMRVRATGGLTETPARAGFVELAVDFDEIEPEVTG
jgi:hypothetical protein